MEWQKFLESHCNENLQITKTPAYTIPMIRKLLETALSEAPYTRSRNCALRLLEDMALSNRLDSDYTTLDKETTLKYFRECALELMIAQNLIAGKLLTKKLVKLSLQHDDAWYDLLQVFARALRQNQQRIQLCILYEVLCEIGEDHFGMEVNNYQGDIRHQLAAFLEPVVRENGDQFHAMLVTLLREDHGGVLDDRPFVILRFFHHVFTDPGYRTALMEAAIMSPLFTYPFDQRTLAAAIYVRVCIEHEAEFTCSPAMISRLNDIVLLLRNGWIAWSEREAEKLATAVIRKKLVNLRSRY